MKFELNHLNVKFVTILKTNRKIVDVFLIEKLQT
jgi:hypothetical protein